MALPNSWRRAQATAQVARRPASEPGRPPAEIDTQVPHACRIYDYMLGGTNNFSVDQVMAETVFGAVYDGGMAAARSDFRANRAFLGRAVRHLVVGAGVRQFLDIGTGIPTEDNVHQVAQRHAPESRIVYVDYDLMVQAHAQLLLDSTPEGATAFVQADLRDPEVILRKAAATLDLDRPVALVLVGILHVIPDRDDAYGVVGRLLDALAPGSHMVLSHLAGDINPDEMAEMVERLNGRTRETFVLRDEPGVARFFDGLDLLDPGVVPVDQWRPDAPPPAQPGAHRTTPIYAAVGRKP